MTSALWFDQFARAAHRIQGKTYLPLSSLLKDMIKDSDEQPVEEIQSMRSGRVLSAKASVSMELGCITFPLHWCVDQPGSSPNPYHWDFYGGFHDLSQTAFSVLLLSQENGRAGLKLQASVGINFQAQDRTTSANCNGDNLRVPINSSLDQKHSISSLPIPNSKPTLGQLTSLLFVIFYLPPTCSLFFILQKLPGFHSILWFSGPLRTETACSMNVK